MAKLHESTVKSVVWMLKRSRNKLQAELDRLSAEARVKLRDQAHTAISNHQADCASNAPSITLSHLIPSLRKRIAKFNETIFRVKETHEFGTCITCEEEIPLVRLNQVPLCRQCTACKGEQEVKDRGRNVGRAKHLVFL